MKDRLDQRHHPHPNLVIRDLANADRTLGARSGNSASLQFQVSRQSGQTDKIKGFRGDILTNTSPNGGQDASIVIIEATAGRCADINESVSFLGRVIGKVIVTA